MKIVVGASSFGKLSEDIQKIISDNEIEIVKNPYGRKMTLEEIIEHAKDADGLLAGLEPLNEKFFSECPKLRALARIGIGMDNVDAEAARRYGIKVSNTPEAPTDAVAEMVLSALLTICHQIIPSNNDIHNGIWKKRMGKSITELTILVIGYGHIGEKVTGLFRKLGANVLIYDKYQKSVSTCSLEEGIRVADVISIHASGKEELLDDKCIESMKDGVIILNSARGNLINEQAVYDGLVSGKISFFWGDALWQEPYTGIVANCENAILTPHSSTYTSICRKEMEKQALINLLKDLNIIESRRE